MAHIYTDGTEHYDATLEAKRFAYQQMLKHIDKLITHVDVHGSVNPQADRLRATVKHYMRNVNRLAQMHKAGK